MKRKEEQITLPLSLSLVLFGSTGSEGKERKKTIWAKREIEHMRTRCVLSE